MSLINKMLQDLDARGGGATGTGATVEVRPVSSQDRWPRTGLAAGAGVLVVVLAGAGYAGWQYLHKPASSAANAPAATTPAAAASGAGTSPGGTAPGQAANNIAQVAKATAAGAALSDEQALQALARARQLAADKAARDAKANAAAAPSPDEVPKSRKATHARASADNARAPAWAGAGVRTDKHVAAAASKARAGAAMPATEESGPSSQQRAENEYRRALAALQDGRVTEAIAGLEQAVYLYPRHDAARQTLVGLLVERKQYADAIRHLQFAISLDPRQSGMTMLLARLQSEQGGSGIETLQRGLQYASGNADYRALLAGMLQRAQRHHEAVEQYQAALKLQPSNGVWWMGVGISLQADKRTAEAHEAFVHARDSGRLTPELQAFVERKLLQPAGQ